MSGRLLPVHDTRLWVEERGPADAFPLLCLHGGPGLDHTVFGDYLDPLTDRYRLVLVDQRAQGRSDRGAPPATWTLATMASDVSGVAAALGVERYAVLGHSYGAFVALQHAVDAPGAAAATVVSSGVAASSWLAGVEAELAGFEPVELRRQVADSWEREQQVSSDEEVRALLADQLPFHFADPRDPRIDGLRDALRDLVGSAAVLRHFAAEEYGGIDVVDRLGEVTQPVLVVAGRHDRVCPVAAAEQMVAALPHSRLVVCESAGHMTYVEEPETYLAAVRRLLDHVTG